MPFRLVLFSNFIQPKYQNLQEKKKQKGNKVTLTLLKQMKNSLALTEANNIDMI